MKDGYKTTEFWLAFAAGLLGALVASGVIPSSGPWAQVVALVSSVLVALGYTGARVVIKKSDTEATTTRELTAAAREVAPAGPTSRSRGRR